MGEAKRRRKAQEAFEARMVEAPYRPARRVYALPAPSPDDVENLRAWACEREAAPRAFSSDATLAEPAAFRTLFPDAEAGEGEWLVWDGQGGVEVLPQASMEKRFAWSREDNVFYEFTGEAVMLSASLRQPLPPEATRGLVRLADDGMPIVDADAPLAYQAACAFAAIEIDPEEELTAAVDMFRWAGWRHLHHLRALARRLHEGAVLPAPAWCDLHSFDHLAEPMVAPGVYMGDEPEDPEEVLERLVRRAGVIDGGEPFWHLGPRVDAPASLWVVRDMPGWGIRWTEWDRLVKAALPAGLPAPHAASVAVELFRDEDGGAIRRATALVDAAEPRATGKGGLRLAAEGDLVLALIPERETVTLVAWKGEGEPAGAADPYMTEDLAGLDDIEHLFDLPNRFGDDLGSLDLLGLLPEIETMAFYPEAALTKAHREGATLADLCASLASLLEESPPEAVDVLDAFLLEEYVRIDAVLAEGQVPEAANDDPAGEEAIGRRFQAKVEAKAAERAAMAESLRRAGGEPKPRLRALFHDAVDDLADLDLRREATLLQDVHRRGGTLLDLAVEACLRGEGVEVGDGDGDDPDGP